MKKHPLSAIVNEQLLSDARAIINAAREKAIRSVDSQRVLMYWNLGRRIFEEE